MKAVILIGGLGRRLDPLTLATPKPLLPVLNRPFLRYQLEILRPFVSEVVLCASDPRPFRRVLGEREGGLRLRYVEEGRPLGTGGAVGNAAARLAKEPEFLVLNGDVLNSFHIGAFLKAHRRSKARGTIALTRVADPTNYGLVETSPEGRVRRFIEKPSLDEALGNGMNAINAGAYVLDRSVLPLLKGGPSSLERDLFPKLLSGGGLFAFQSKGYWIDIGTLDRYLQVHLDILGGRTGLAVSKTRPSLDGGRIAVGRAARIDPAARLSGCVSVGPNCRIEAGAALRDCVLLEGVRVGRNARVERCVVGARCDIGERATVASAQAIAGGSTIEAFRCL